MEDYIKIVEAEMAKSTKKKTHVIKVDFNEVAFAIRAAEFLKDWNVITSFKINRRDYHYELVIKER